MMYLKSSLLLVNILLGILAYGFAYPADNKRCGGAFSGLFGRVMSPNFPAKYPDNLRCSWDIAVPDGYHISLNFTQFDTENYEGCSYDYVIVKEKNNTVGRFCGNEKRLDSNVPRGPLFMTSNQAGIEFITDHSNEEVFHGFEAHFAAQDVNECEKDNGGCMHFCHNYIGGHYCTCKIGYHLAKNNRSCIVECKGTILREKEGFLQSPEYPNNYPPFADCEWNVAVEKGYSIVLEFQDFNIEEHPDYLCPYDWLRVQFSDGFKALCGKELPKKIVSNTNWVLLNFHSDRDESRRGFKIRYYLERVKCPPIIPPENGQLIGERTFAFKDRLLFGCSPGYDLVGSSSIECLNDGQWTSKPPICKIKSCGRPPVSSIGLSFIGNSFTYKSTVNYNCTRLYNLIGQNTSTCLANGSWSGEIPKCKPVCGRTLYPSTPMLACRGRILSGHKAQQGGHPWIAAVHIQGSSVRCGGALLNDEWVLTAAHCVTHMANEQLISRDKVSISLGRHRRRERSRNIQTARVSQMIKHPNFNFKTFDADVALIQLDKKVRMTDYVRPICLPTQKREKKIFQARQHVIIAGWGITEKGIKSEHLKEACVQLVSRKDCNDSYKKKESSPVPITENMICGGSIRGVNVCKGDSGSPVIAYDDETKSYVLGGIVSFGSRLGCASNYEVFSRVPKLMAWIRLHVLSDLEDPFK